LLLVDVRGPKKASNRITPWDLTATLMQESGGFFVSQPDAFNRKE